MTEAALRLLPKPVLETVLQGSIGSVADAMTWEPSRTYDIWHDRASFHFLTEEHDRTAYVKRLKQALKVGGHAIIATFALDGPSAAAVYLSCATTRRASAGSWPRV